MKFRIERMAMAVLAAALTACGGGGPGLDGDALVGRWILQDGPTDVGDGVRLEDTVVEYGVDGTSDYSARMVVAPAGGETVTLRLDGDVRWRLEETVLTRTLERMDVTPETETDAARQLADMYAQGLNASPPARFIVQRLDEETLELLDPDTGDTLRFARAPG